MVSFALHFPTKLLLLPDAQDASILPTASHPSYCGQTYIFKQITPYYFPLHTHLKDEAQTP